MKLNTRIKNFVSNPLTAVWFGAFVDILVLSTLNPFLPRILLDMGATIPQTGLLLSANIFIGFFSGILWGALSDKYGRRPILIMCLAGTLAGNVLLAFSTSIPLFLAARIVDGIFARNTQIILTIIGDMVAPGKRSKEMSKPGAGWIAGGLIGPVIGGALYRFGISGLASFSSLLYAAALIIAIVSVKESNPAANESAEGADSQTRERKPIFSMKLLRERAPKLLLGQSFSVSYPISSSACR